MPGSESTSPAAAIVLQVCSAPDADRAEAIAALGEKDWGDLLAMAREHRVGPLLYRAAGDLRDPGRASALRKMAADGVPVALGQAHALSRASRILKHSGLAPVALKGSHLDFAIYPEPALRPLRDIDLLLLPDHAEEARALLLAEGFAKVPEAGTYGLDHSHQLPPVRDPASGTLIEIHHRLSATGWPGEPELTGRILREERAITLFGENVRVPSDHANALHLMAHAVLHHTFSAGPLILADLHFLAARGTIDWDRLLAEARDLRLDRPLALLAAIARRFGASWIPGPLQAACDDADRFALEAAQALVAPREEFERRQMLRRIADAGEAANARSAAVRALRPDAGQLARLAGTATDDPRRWLAYPSWARHRAARYLAARRSAPALNLDLRDWLRGS